jgi:hypothetical protein
VLFRWPGYFVKTLFRRACATSRYPRGRRFTDLTAWTRSPLGSSPWARHAAAAYARVDADRRTRVAAYTARRRVTPNSTPVALCRDRTR